MPMPSILKITCLALLMSTSAVAQDSFAEHANNVKDIIFDDTAFKLAIKGLPIKKTDNVYNFAYHYTTVAKGFWTQKQCNVLQGEDLSDYTQKVEKYTSMIRLALTRDLKFTEAEAQKRAELLQMYALNDMSARKFMECGEKAISLVKVSAFHLKAMFR